VSVPVPPTARTCTHYQECALPLSVLLPHRSVRMRFTEKRNKVEPGSGERQARTPPAAPLWAPRSAPLCASFLSLLSVCLCSVPVRRVQWCPSVWFALRCPALLLLLLPVAVAAVAELAPAPQRSEPQPAAVAGAQAKTQGAAPHGQERREHRGDDTTTQRGGRGSPSPGFCGCVAVGGRCPLLPCPALPCPPSPAAPRGHCRRTTQHTKETAEHTKQRGTVAPFLCGRWSVRAWSLMERFLCAGGRKGKGEGREQT
jgi:hypothetical protein